MGISALGVEKLVPERRGRLRYDFRSSQTTGRGCLRNSATSFSWCCRRADILDVVIIDEASQVSVAQA
jgi:hypothetical protein